MRTCEICGKNIRFRYKRTASGYICSSCCSLMPSWVDVACSEKEYLSFAKNITEQRNKEFNYTASYRNLYIDGVHNMFALSGFAGLRQFGKPKYFRDIFCISELTEVGMFCTNLRNIGRNSNCVVCDVKFRYTANVFNEKKIEKEVTLSTNEECPYDYAGNGIIDCREPVTVSAFRALFNQMIDNEINNIRGKLDFIRKTKDLVTESRKSEEWARGVLLFDNDEPIDAAILKSRRNALIKLYHPDLSNTVFDNSNSVTALVIQAYEVLNSLL